MYRQLLISSFVVLVGVFFRPCDAYISCYNCSPDDHQNCTYENITQVDQQACLLQRKLHYDNAFEKHIAAENNPSYNATCYSAYFVDEHNPEKSGIYRGCYLAETQSPCKELLEDFRKTEKDGSFTECHTCVSDLCNNHRLNGASHLNMHSMIVLLISMILLLPVQSQFN